MRARFVATLLAAMSAPLSLQAAEPARLPSTDALSGHWEGRVEKGGKVFRLALNFDPLRGTALGYVDFVDLPLYGIPFVPSVCGQALCLNRHPDKGPVSSLSGHVENDRYSGSFTGAGAKDAPFILERKSLSAQILREEDVTFKNGDVSLAGTLVFPAGPGPFAAVVIAHGSDPDNRATAVYRGQGVLLARHGIAALVYDKRGTGKSTGDYTTAGLDDLAGDTLAGVALLRGRSDIRHDRIGVAGHSQGGWIAPLAATLSPNVGFVLATSPSALGPMAQSMYHNANELRAAGVPEDDVKRAQALRDRMYQLARTGSVDDHFLADLEVAHKEPWFAASKLPYPFSPTIEAGERRLLLFEPIPVWEKVRVPVLAIWGGADINLPAKRSQDLIAAALKVAGNTHVTLRVLPGLSHSFYEDRSVNEPWDFPRGSPSYEQLVTAWIDETLAPRS